MLSTCSTSRWANAPDAIVWEHAVQTSAVILTKDEDFAVRAATCAAAALPSSGSERQRAQSRTAPEICCRVAEHRSRRWKGASLSLRSCRPSKTDTSEGGLEQIKRPS